MTPDEKRAKAEQMRRLAAEAINPEVRESYLRLAADWEGMADESDGRAPRSAKPAGNR